MAGGATTPHVARLGYLYGPGEVARPSRPRVSPVARWLDAAGGGLALEVRSDDPRREWTYAPDLAAARARVVDGPAAGRPIHVGSPHVSRDSEVAALVAAAFPGTEIVTVPAVGRSKAPMIPSDVPGLSDFTWTGTPAGVRSLVAARATSAPDVTPGVSA